RTSLTTRSSEIPNSLACSGICFSTSGVRTKPGQMTLERTLWCAPSLAITRARPSSQCFAATYAALSGEASWGPHVQLLAPLLTEGRRRRCRGRLLEEGV